jgi:Fe-S-cluster containining protein
MSEPATRIAVVRLMTPQGEATMEMAVPTGTMPLRLMLPLFHETADALISLAVKAARAEGGTVSCRAGCGACCRQLVPIAPVEARRLCERIDAMPEPRRTTVRERFAAAEARLTAAGLRDRLLRRGSPAPGGLRALGLEYFALGIACPFLENESCSIYADRPGACREYLVVSPAANCSTPTTETVRKVPMPLKVSNALMTLEHAGATPSNQWVPLSLAPVWAGSAAPEPPPRRGTEWTGALLAALGAPPPEDAA